MSQPATTAKDPAGGAITNDFEKTIAEAFMLFDTIGNKTIDMKDVSAAVRALGVVPTEKELREMEKKLEDFDKTGFVELRKFVEVVGAYITELKGQPASAEVLMEAFRKMDKENKGCLSPEFLENAITKEGEPFNQEELREMFAQAIDPETGQITYEYYINQLLVNVEPNIYSIIPPPPPEEPKKY